jgi:Flp pilus assembly protein TadG
MRRLSEEDGATAVIVALMLTALAGFAALTIDVGRMYVEVRELQNGADAAALAVAQDCAEGNCATNQATADQFTDANSKDGLSDATVQYPGLDGANSVTVTSTTRTLTGTAIDFTFARAFGDEDSGTLSRSATAAWGNLGGGTTIPIAICNRAWEHWTTTVGLPSGPPAHYLSFGGANSAPDATCTNPSYDTYNGGFGFLRRDGDCRMVSRLESGDTWVKGIQGNNPQDPPSLCSVDDMYDLFKRIINGTEPAVTDSIVLVPIFDAYRNSTSEFRLIGYGAFRLMGYDINGGPGEKRFNMSNSECRDNVGPPNNASCLKGYFTEFVTLDGLPEAGAPGFGATVIALTR